MKLDFISDERLTVLTRIVIEKAQTAADEAEVRLHNNTIDPFSALFDASRQNISLIDWLEQEKSRQIQKTLQNALGEFHQHVLGSCPGWEDLGLGGSLDLRNTSKKIIAELKNKHNTLNSSGLTEAYDRLQKHLDYSDSYRGFTGYLVHIVPKTTRSLNKPFIPAERSTRRPERKDLRIMDGQSFYELATGDKDAIKKLYNHLPTILGRVTDASTEKMVSSKLFNELFAAAYIEK